LFDVDPARVHVIHNGIDCSNTGKWIQPARSSTTASIQTHRICCRRPDHPQKGIPTPAARNPIHESRFPIVLCAAAPGHAGDGRRNENRSGSRKSAAGGSLWINEMVDQTATRELYSHAAVFVCPSIYEPFGIINLEAMACETAVVASAVGGIKEVVVDGETDSWFHSKN